jgi:hypothetical protein
MTEAKTPAPEQKKTRQMSFTVLEDGTVRADFGEGVDPLIYHPAQLPESTWPSLLAKGSIARLQSYTSGLQGDERTPVALRARVEKGITDLQAGILAAERIGGAGEEISIEAEAAHLYRVGKAAEKNQTYDSTLEETAAAFSALTDEQKKQLKATARFQAAYAKVKAGRQAKKAEKLGRKASEDDVDF